ncbi:MAG: Patatin [Candidatus Magnetoglobus multicellularis str. Araruama]|uniref:Patatin n=1 Tax=Candidatus Magnetoglobus multicellularis str. Araruama TaxID=890399 RepID=A0A1V1PIH0_9BACT|nr:MAG: Patatin [Candidatus Magnetoglobus multicellularis str. Araruama]
MNENNNHTPIVGVALGSGSARGFAHIGVLKALQEMDIYPQVISGSSVGAFVGGAYISNHLKSLEEWVCQLTWKDVLGFFDFTFSGAGIIMGDRFSQFLADYLGEQNIQDFSIRFGAVSTELTTGREVWFQEGLLHDAVRASMSLPGLFSPVKIKGQMLADGGIVNPVPVSICRAMGATFVLAVNLNNDVVGKHFANKPKTLPIKWTADIADVNDTDMPQNPLKQRLIKGLKQSMNAVFPNRNEPKPKSPGMFDILASSVNIMQDRITRSRMAIDPPDVLVEPCLSHVGWLEYYRAQECIQEGYDAVWKIRDAINKFCHAY